MTIDGFVILTPILMLAVIALLGFVGCSFHISPAAPEAGPTSVAASGRDGKVELSWDPYDGATGYTVKRGVTSGDYPVTRPGITDTKYPDPGLTNGTPYFYVVTATFGASETVPVGEVSATPTLPSRYATVETLGGTQNLVTSFRGMAIRIAQAKVMVTKLGRGFAMGNTGTHRIKIVDGVSGIDVLDAWVDVTMTTAVPGEFQFAPLSKEITLNPGVLYFVVSEETAGGDLAYRQDTVVSTTNIAVLEGPVFTQSIGGPYTTVAAADRCIGPVNFDYYL